MLLSCPFSWVQPRRSRKKATRIELRFHRFHIWMNMNDCVPITILLLAYHSLLPSSSKGIICSLSIRISATGALFDILIFSRDIFPRSFCIGGAASCFHCISSSRYASVHDECIRRMKMSVFEGWKGKNEGFEWKKSLGFGIFLSAASSCTARRAAVTASERRTAKPFTFHA